MIRTWTIRYEAKLNFFKQCSRLANFKNISLSLSNRHQRWICYELSSGNILQANLECGPSLSSSTLKQEPKHIQQAILKEFPNADKSICLSRPKWIKHHSTVYKTSTCR